MRSEVSGVRTITGLKPHTSCGCWRLKVSTKCSQHSASSPSWKFKDLLNTLLWTREQAFKHGPSTRHYREISLTPPTSYHLPAARLLASCPLSQTRKNPRISLEPHDQAEAEARLVEPGHCGHHGAQLGSATRRLNEFYALLCNLHGITTQEVLTMGATLKTPAIKERRTPTINQKKVKINH